MMDPLKILFCHPSSGMDDCPEPPLGLGYLMQVAKQAGCRYAFFDQDHQRSLSLDESIAKVDPDLVAISFMTPQYSAVLQMLARIKKLKPNVKIVVGGPHATALPEETMKEMQEVDFLCRGEGEMMFAELIDCFKGEKELEKIDGLSFRGGDGIRLNRPRALMSGDELARCNVDWQGLYSDGPYISKLSYRRGSVPVFPVITARGCPCQCTFCDEGNIWRRRVRMRPIANVVDEITCLVEEYGARYFNILDDTFTIKEQRVLDFCDAVRPLNLHFRITATVTSVNENTLTALKSAGCDLVAYGVESGDEDVLRAMKKRQSVEDIKRAFALTRKAGIPSYALCMVGNIGEDWSAVKKTASLLSEIKPDLASCAIMVPYPGSENYRICRTNGWIMHHEWDKWIPSVLRTKGFRVVSRTDKMDESEILKAYYFMNKRIVTSRFGHKYGRLFFLRIAFYADEILPRLRTIGVSALVGHAAGLFSGRRVRRRE